MQNNFLLFLGVCSCKFKFKHIQINFKSFPSIPLVTAKFSKALSLRPPEGIHVRGPGAERPRTSCLLLSNNDQLQADSTNLQEFNHALTALNGFMVLILLDWMIGFSAAPAQSCWEETFRPSGTWTHSPHPRHSPAPLVPGLESHPSNGGNEVSYAEASRS